MFVANDHEIAAAAELLGVSEAEAEIAREISRATDTLVVHTQGARGAVASLPDGVFHRAEAPPVRVVDTTGAGELSSVSSQQNSRVGKVSMPPSARLCRRIDCL